MENKKLDRRTTKVLLYLYRKKQKNKISDNQLQQLNRMLQRNGLNEDEVNKYVEDYGYKKTDRLLILRKILKKIASIASLVSPILKIAAKKNTEKHSKKSNNP